MTMHVAAHCPLCGGASIGPLESHQDVERYTLYQCGSCTAQFWIPLKNPGATWYERDVRYADRNAAPILKANEKHLAVLDACAHRIGSVLDVGCGVGNFLGEAKQRGWECTGIDFDHDAIEGAKRTFGLSRLSVDEVTTFAHAHPEEKFDLVVFFDVFEHIDNHKDFLAAVHSLLKDDGVIALSVPYRHSWRWLIPNDVPPRHLTRWDEHSLAKGLAQHGFVVEQVFKHPASIYFIALKLRFNYGRFLTLGLVRRARARSQGAPIADGAAHQSAQESFLVRAARAVAYAKDMFIFGLPAAVIWTVLLCTHRRYTDITVVAKKFSARDGASTKPNR